jgi:hypothetical protein
MEWRKFQLWERIMKPPASHAKRPSASPRQNPPKSPTSPPNTSNAAPRPPFFTDVVRAEICSVLAAGCMFRDAARYVGCTIRAIAELIRCDREFARQIDRALVNRELILISHIRKAAEDSWKAAAWLLAHTVGGRYGEHIPTLAEELEAEESQQLAATIAELQRASSDAPAEFGPYQPTPTTQQSDPHPAAHVEQPKVEPMNVNNLAATTYGDEALSKFEIPGFGTLVPAQATESNPNDLNNPLATVKRIWPPTTTPASPTTSPTPLPATAFKSGKVSPAQIRESMRAIDDYLKS